MQRRWAGLRMRDAASANCPRRRVREGSPPLPSSVHRPRARDTASSDGVERTNAQNARRGNRVPAGGTDCDDCGERTAEFCENPEHGVEYCDYDNRETCADGVLTWCCDRESSYPMCGDSYGECNPYNPEKYCDSNIYDHYDNPVVCLNPPDVMVFWCCDRDSSQPECGDKYGQCKKKPKKTAKKLAIGIIIGIVVAIIVIIASIVACCICCRRRGA